LTIVTVPPAALAAGRAQAADVRPAITIIRRRHLTWVEMSLRPMQQGPQVAVEGGLG